MGRRIKPMNDIEILREMLVCDVQVSPQQEKGKRLSVKLLDCQAHTVVKVNGLPHDSIVIRAEQFKTPRYVFKGSKRERKRADFVIVSNDEKEGRWIICIEIQGGKRKTEGHVKAQLKGALCVVKYCQCIGKEFWKEKDFLNDYNYRFVSMEHTSASKKGIRGQNYNSSENSPDTFWRFRGPYHHFSKLMRG